MKNYNSVTGSESYSNNKSGLGKKIGLTGLALIIAIGGTVGVSRALRNRPIGKSPITSTSIELVIDDLSENKQYANQLIQETLEMLDENNAISSDTYTDMFGMIREKAEENPELMEHFGDNAQNYMKKQILDDYIGTIEDSYRSFGEILREKSQPIIDALGRAKDYVMDRLRGE